MLTIDGCQLQMDGDTVWVNGPDAQCKLRLKLDQAIPERLPFLDQTTIEDIFIDIRMTAGQVAFKEGS